MAKFILLCLGVDWPGWVRSLPSIRHTQAFGIWHLSQYFWELSYQVSNAHRAPYSTSEGALQKQTSNLASTDGRINYVADTVTEIILQWHLEK